MRTSAFIVASIGTCLFATAAGAQSEFFRYSFQWNDNGNNNGNGNGVIEPGEAARVWLNVSFTQVGTIVNYTPPPGPGFGPVAGLDAAEFDFIGSANSTGTWLQSGPGFNGVTGSNWGRRSGFNIGSIGDPIGPGASLSHVATGQFVLPGGTANPVDPVDEIWRGRWTPASYTNRLVTFTGQDPLVHPPGGFSYVLIQYGTDPGGSPLYTSKKMTAEFTSIPIPVVPSPGSAAVLGGVGLFALYRRRSL